MGLNPASSRDEAGGAVQLIEAVALAVDAATIDFTDIPQGYTHLRLDAVLRGADAADGINVSLTVNGTGGGLYWNINLANEGDSLAAGESAGDNSLAVLSAPAANSPAGQVGLLVAEFPFYTDTAGFKQIRTFGGSLNSVFTTYRERFAVFGDDVPITRITLTPSADEFAAGSKATLYGIA